MSMFCPHCKAAIEPLGADPLLEISCPSCGRDFPAVIGLTTPDEKLGWTGGLETTLGGGVPVAAQENDGQPSRPSAGAGRRFRLLQQHAQGGLGNVSIARDLELRRNVAFKTIRREFADQGHSRLRFVREALITGNLEHPGIVPVYSLGEDEQGQPFYAMRFVQGVSLAEEIARFHGKPRRTGRTSRSLQFRILLNRFVSVCEAIEFAHSRGVLHRDLKPANIMLGAYGETLVVDWGLAKSISGEPGSARTSGEPLGSVDVGLESETRDGSVMGTPAYMSPEQAKGKIEELGPATDVYSLGATLYCLLSGRPPFHSSDDVLHKVSRGEFPPPSAHGPRVPKPLEAICLRAMARAPDDRYQSARELAEDVERWLADERVTAHRESWSDKLVRRVRRHRPWAGALALATVLVLIVSVAAWLRESMQRRRVEQALHTLKLEDIVRRIPTTPSLCKLSLEEFPEHLRTLPWALTRDAARQRHRIIEMDQVVVQCFLSPRASTLVFSTRNSLRGDYTLWSCPTHAAAKPVKLLDGAEILKSLSFPSEHLFRVEFAKDDRVHFYSTKTRAWSSEVPANVESTSTAPRARPAAPETVLVDGVSQEVVASTLLDDGRFVALLADDERRTFGNAVCRVAVGRRDDGGSEVFAASGVFTQHGMYLRPRSVRITPCSGSSRVLLHDTKRVVALDVDQGGFVDLTPAKSGRVIQVTVSHIGDRVAFAYQGRRISEKTRIFVTVTDELGDVLFEAFYFSPELGRQAAEQGITGGESTLFSRWIYPQLQLTFSRDSTALFCAEADFRGERSVVNLFTFGDTAGPLAWQAHDDAIMAADLLPGTRQLVSVDRQGIVRNWQDGTLTSEWRLENLHPPASIVIRNDTIMVLRWEANADVPLGSGPWDWGVARFSGTLYDRETGQQLRNLPQVTIPADPAHTPKRTSELNALDLRWLPFLSADGSRVGWLKQDGPSVRVQVAETRQRDLLIDRAVPDALRARFSPDGRSLLVLRRANESAFLVESTLLENPDSFAVSRIQVSPRHAAELSKLAPLFNADSRLWVVEACAAWLATDFNTARNWAPLFNWNGVVQLANLQERQMILELDEQRYFDFRHRTQSIRLRSHRGGKVIREFELPFPLDRVWAKEVDDARVLVACGPDRLLRFWSIDEGISLGTLELPFRQHDGLAESLDGKHLLGWGDGGKLLVLGTEFGEQ